MMDVRVCRRLMPFGEHRTMAAVIETERLQSRYERGESLGSPEARRLQTLLSRATIPDPPQPRVRRWRRQR